MAPKKTDRRGVLLLVVLSLLVIFALTALTFVVVSRHERQAAKMASQLAQTSKDPQELLDEAMHQLVRDTSNPRSAVRGHSLLRDLYGDDQIEAVVTKVHANLSSPMDYQFLILEVSAATGFTLSQTDEYYTGCVLTMLDGPAKNFSTRIVRYVAASPPTILHSWISVMVPQLDTSSLTGEQLVNELQTRVAGGATIRLLINGRPFNGTGFGYHRATGKLDSKDLQGLPHALCPNHVGVDYQVEQQYLQGGADESYDAVDYQNMALAMVPENPSETDLTRMIIPSFHRPALLHYWRHQPEALIGLSAPEDVKQFPPALQRKIMLRPNYVDHPNFPTLEQTLRVNSKTPPWAALYDPPPFPSFLEREIHGPWDVDNDGDGVRDSVWLDLGLPVSRTANGRLYKPLFAVLCVDMDGKLNLNAHGSLQHLINRQVHLTTATEPMPVGLAGNNHVIQSSSSLPQGSGYGPPEISLLPLFTGNPLEHDHLLLGLEFNGDLLKGRYARDAAPQPVPGTKEFDRLARVHFFQYPLQGQTPSSFTSPHDLSGRYAVGIDPRGVPNFEGTEEGQHVVKSGLQWSPYELNLSRQATRGLQKGPESPDSPYTTAELEPILRAYDLDAGSLPGRLQRLLPVAFQSNLARTRHLVTTDSFDLPVPNILTTEELRTEVALPRHVPDLLRARLRRGLGYPVAPATLTSNQENTLNGHINRLLAPDLLRGLRMDINRPFGNGRDDNDNGVVDEPAEALLAELLWSGCFPNGQPFPFVGLDVDGDEDSDVADRQLARQHYARHLYVLLMLLTDARVTDIDTTGYLHPVHPNDDEAHTVSVQRRLTARRLAQWAVNTVDFRDADAIMTPFEYDENPFDGWQPDGDLSTEEGGQVVWGAEYPHLVLTETLAFHDRRVKDTAVGTKRSEGDLDLDSLRIPKGSAYVELYCTGNQYASLPKELYTDGQLDLGRISPDGLHPVWRLAITTSRIQRPENDLLKRLGIEQPQHLLNPSGDSEASITQLDPQNFYMEGSAPSLGQQPGNPEPIEIERLIWFSDQQPPSLYPDRHRVYFNKNPDGQPIHLSPGRYAVVAPRRHNWIGWDSSAGQESQHKIVVDNNAAQIVNNDGTPGFSPAAMKPVLGIIAAAVPPGIWALPQNSSTVVGMSISEPLVNAYYPQPNLTSPNAGDPASGALGGFKDGYINGYDEPLDSRPGRPLFEDNLLATGTTFNYKTVFLQRLSNPLLPWDRKINPYLTVDWLPIDLTVFNGEDSDSGYTGPPPFDPEDPVPDPTRVHFETRQRGSTQPLPLGGMNLWSTVSEEPRQTLASGPVGNIFKHNLGQYPTIANPHSGQTLGFLNLKYGVGRATPATHVGDPPRPFPWLTFNDRPFVSHYELMQVPSSSPGRLPYEFTMAAVAEDPYQADPGQSDEAKYFQSRAPFGHLLNFFQTSTDPGEAAHFYRLFEYTHVPSRFVGGDTVLNPQWLSGSSQFAKDLMSPFNKVSCYRDPGRVNINTLASRHRRFEPIPASGGSVVWQGIYHQQAANLVEHPGPTWQMLVDSRRGFGSSNNSVLMLDPTVPTYFANPFRAADAGRLVPLPQLERPGIEGTLLRSDAVAAGQAPSSDPLFGVESQAQRDHTDRNSYFRYASLRRLGNLLTTRSNVYAVWITLGFFEVEPAVQLPGMTHSEFAQVYPGGYRLGRELDSDTGGQRRHRGFYMIDRSIPVAFEPGENHNVDRAVLVRRFIE